jgi:hypothetical protein
MAHDKPSSLNNVITIDDERIGNHLDRVVRGRVKETLTYCWTSNLTGFAMRNATSVATSVA